MTYPVSIKKVGMSGINVARLHSNHILDQFVGWRHCFLEKGNNDLVEFLFKAWVSPEKLYLRV